MYRYDQNIFMRDNMVLWSNMNKESFVTVSITDLPALGIAKLLLWHAGTVVKDTWKGYIIF